MRWVYLLGLVLLVACTSRPEPLPTPHRDRLPWGAVSTNVGGSAVGYPMFENVEHATAGARVVEDTDGDGIPNYAMLGISGGGSNGAFTVGLLSGWTEHGNRPKFQIVTGISTGALISTFAFLGSQYDAELERLYSTITDDDVFRKRNPLSLPYSDSLRDTSPLRQTIARWIDVDILERVASEHAKGRRLYVGSTDLDGNRLVTWDLGAIASSERPDRLQRYRDVLLASASIPIAFPPVYFPVEANGETYWQMHVDGGASANVFFSGFMFDVQRAIARRHEGRGAQVDFYLIVNSALEPSPLDQPIAGSMLSIAAASVWSMSWAAQTSQLARMYRTVQGLGQNFHLAGIPPDYPAPLDSSTFDPESMTQLMQFAKAQASSGYPWLAAPPGTDWRETHPEWAPLNQGSN